MDFLLHTRGLSLFIELFIKSSIISGVALLITHVARKQSASFRHLVLAVAMIGLLLLPLTMAFGPGWKTGIPGFHAPYTVEKSGHMDFKPNRHLLHKPLLQTGGYVRLVSSVPEKKTSVWQFFRNRAPYGLIILWALGVAMCIVILSIGIYGTSRLTRKGVKVDGYPWRQLIIYFLRFSPIRRKVRLIQSHRCVVPMTCGVVSPAIVMPEESIDWTFEQCSSVLFHELSHVKRRDFPVRILARIACALYWFNPLCWEVYRCMKREQEKACDEMVLQIGVKPSIYATHLLEMRRTLENNKQLLSAALGIADRAEFKERLLHILKKQINLKEVKVKTKIFIMFIGVMVILLIGTAKADPVLSGNPTEDKKLEKNVQQLENEIKNIEIQKLEVMKTIDEQKSVIGKLGEKEQNKKLETLELKLEKILEQIEVTSDTIEKTLEEENLPSEETMQKLQAKLDRLMDMEQELEKKGSQLEEIEANLYGEEARVENEKMKQYQEESRKMELESFELEKESRKLEMQSRKLEEQSRLLEKQQEKESDINVQKKLEEKSLNLEKEAKKLELESLKLEEASRLLEEKNNALEVKMEELERLEEKEVGDNNDELEDIEAEEEFHEDDPLSEVDEVDGGEEEKDFTTKMWR